MNSTIDLPDTSLGQAFRFRNRQAKTENDKRLNIELRAGSDLAIMSTLEGCTVMAIAKRLCEINQARAGLAGFAMSRGEKENSE